MNILLATLVFPYPINDGGKSGTFRMIDALRNHYNITLICKESNEANLTALRSLWPNVTIMPFKGSPSPKKDGFLVKFLKKVTRRELKLSKSQVMEHEMALTNSNLCSYYFEDLIDIFTLELKTKTYDLVQIDFIELAPLVYFIPKNIAKIFVHHELRYKRMEREQATLEILDLSNSWKINTTKTLETALISLYDKVVCLTENDLNTLASEGILQNKLVVSPLPMITIEQNINKPFQSRNRLIFLGPDQHYPNLDGIDWFLNKCWRPILEKNPQVSLHVVGKWSPEKASWFSQFQNVFFDGFVEDLSTVMEGSVMIVPLRIGSGMRMKILEGVAYHVPIISTSIGAEGLPMKHNLNCKICDTPEDFITATLEVLSNSDLQNKYTIEAKKILHEGYSTDECVQLRSTIYKQLQE